MNRARIHRTVVGTVMVISVFCVGCSTHESTVSHPCTTLTKGKAVAVSNRGAIAMAKIGLTPKGLKAQEKCK